MKYILSLLLVASAATSFAQDPTIRSSEVFRYGGVPTSGTTEVQTLTIGGTPTGGTFTITVAGGRTTTPIAFSTTNATLLANINAALVALPNPGPGNITVAAGSLTAGIGTITLTSAGKYAKMANYPAFSATSTLTGTSPTVAIAITTAGVDATFRTAQPGTILVDSVTPGLYFNTGTTQFNPTWTAK